MSARSAIRFGMPSSPRAIGEKVGGNHVVRGPETIIMKYLNQLAIILIISCLGEICADLLPFPIPGALYGLILMFTALCLKIVKLHQVEDVAQFLIEIMPLMFTPPAVGLITKWDILKDVWLQLFIIIVITTFIVLLITGHVAQFVLKHEPHFSSLFHQHHAESAENKGTSASTVSSGDES